MTQRATTRRTLKRRDLLATGTATGLALASVSACDAFSTEPADRRSPGASPDHASQAPEAPVLADRVKDGTLPPVDKRLPRDPLVIKPDRSPGRYGGTWHAALSGPGDTPWLTRTIGYDGLMRWDPAWNEPIANLAASITTEKEGRAYLVRLRPGVKWSDGTPFTSADIAFAYTDVLSSSDVYPEGVPSLFTGSDGQPAKTQVVDEHAVRFTFTAPAGMFLRKLATPAGSSPTTYPKHYLKRFHPAYNPKAGELAEQAGVSTWADLFLNKSDPWTNVDVPTLYAWQVTEPLGSGTRVVAVRNPYYWKTDPLGRQLPYLDRVVYAVINNPETILLKTTNGELELESRHVGSPENKPVLARNRTKGDYEFFGLTPSRMNEAVVQLNMTHEDPEYREAFQDKDFRVGLSYALNREEISGAVFQKQGVPWQGAPRTESQFYDEEFATQYTEYDVTRANRILDEAGYASRDGDGFRTFPNGQRIVISVEVSAKSKNHIATMELVKGYWRKVGIETRIKSEDISLWIERVNANKHDACVWFGEGGLQDAILYGRSYAPFNSGARFAILWYDWYSSGGKAGEKPPEVVRRQLDLYNQVLATADKKERAEVFRQVLAIAKEQFYVIGTVLVEKGYGIVANDFHNVPRSMPSAYMYPNPGPTRPEQYFLAS